MYAIPLSSKNSVDYKVSLDYVRKEWHEKMVTELPGLDHFFETLFYVIFRQIYEFMSPPPRFRILCTDGQ